MSFEPHGPRSTARLSEPSAHKRTPSSHDPLNNPANPQQWTRAYDQMIAAGCGSAEINPPQHSIRWREKCGLIGHSGSSAFRLSTYAVSMSVAGSCFSSESAPGPFHYGIRGRGGTIFQAALPSVERQLQADIRTHLIHRPARDIFPPLGGALVFSYRV
jgi:hypothetical protein